MKHLFATTTELNRKVLELAKEFKQNENKVNVMHCMGGKGRTGTIMSCMLINNKTCQNSDVILSLIVG